MKKIFLFIFFYLLSFGGAGGGFSFGGVGGGCQPASDLKRDFSWNMGYGGFIDSALYYQRGITNMNFNTTIPIISARADSAGFWYSSSSICDSLGRLQFYTNGIFIYGADGHTLAGNDTLNVGAYSQIHFDWGYPTIQATLILPAPNESNKYYVFHQRLNNDIYPVPVELFYTTVDMSLNNGQGGVTSLRNLIISGDSLTRGKLTACRHANGRDWWITQWHHGMHKGRKILLDQIGVHDYGWLPALVPRFPRSATGQCVFSPDGSKFATITNQVTVRNSKELIRGHIEVYDFNRCTGEYSNPKFAILEDTAHLQTLGLSISPNSRYLYTSYWTYDLNVPMLTHQYDLWANDIASTQTVVGVYDGFYDPDFACCGNTSPNLHALAPDGRIYISGGISTRYFNIIQNPDIGGVGCNLQQHCLYFPTFNAGTVDNHPNFRLGVLAGSICDTIVSTINLNTHKIQMELFPNPAINNTRLVWYEPFKNNAKIEIINSIGQIIETIKVQNSTTYQDIDIKNLPNGIYFVKLSTAEKQNYTTKLIKISE